MSTSPIIAVTTAACSSSSGVACGAKKTAAVVEIDAPDGTKGLKWHAVETPEDVFKHAVAEAGRGLSEEEVLKRRERYGPNKMTEGKKRTLLERIWDQVNNALIWVLIGAAIVEAGFQSWPDVILISAVVIINVAIGVVQEGKAEKAAAAIKAMMSTAATVIRDGKKRTVDAEELVPGDLVFIQSGDRVPADTRLVNSTNLQIMEAVLTGESVASEKDTKPLPADAGLGDRKNCTFGGTLVVYGQGTGVVIATGDSAELGKINALVAAVEQQSTPLMDALEVFGQWIAGITLLLALATFLISYLARGNTASRAFSECVGVAVAIIPEGLPSVTTITLALGVQAMARQNAIIRQLPAVETLGSVAVICTDKTGTLTKNEMTVVAVRTSEGAYPVTGSGYVPVGDVCAPLASKEDTTKVPLAGEHKAAMSSLLRAGLIANDASLLQRAAAAAPAAAAAAAKDAAVAPAPSSESAEASAVVVNSANAADWQMSGDPTEGALLTLAMKAGVHNIEAEVHKYPRIATIPFESEYKFMAVAVDLPTGEGGATQRTVLVKGAYDVIIARCATVALGNDTSKSGPIDVPQWLASAGEYSREGLRVLAFAQFIIPSDQVTITTADVLKGEPRLQLNCIVAIVDPPREEAIAAVAECKKAGITTKMITGDHPDTAKTIGGWIGITTAEVLTGARMELMTDAELETHVEGCNIYARASPEHKLRIVRALQKHGHVCAMTGDGVNDAPALKQANVGVAMGITGTEVAKEAGKMILADDNFATIVKAVKEGRVVYDNLVKIILFALPTNFAQGFSILMALIIGLPVPLTPIQVLTVNMVTSVTLGLVLALEKPEPDVMTRKPRDPKTPILDGFTAYRTLVVTTLFVVCMLGNQEWTFILEGDRTSLEVLAKGRGIAMTTLVIAQAAYAVNCRYILGSSMHPMAWFENKWMLAMIALNAGLQCFLLYVPRVNTVWEMVGIDANAWGRVILLSLGIFWFVELEKFLYPTIARAMAPCFASCTRKKAASSADRLDAAQSAASAEHKPAAVGVEHA